MSALPRNTKHDPETKGLRYKVLQTGSEAFAGFFFGIASAIQSNLFMAAVGFESF